MEIFLSILLGIGLSIACGFRSFLPMLVVSFCGKTGLITLNDGFAWLSNDYVLIAFLIATIIEILAYYIPVLDNILDYFSLPLSITAGILLSLSCFKIQNPFLLWVFATMNGAIIVCAVKSTLAVMRGLSSVFFVGITNSLLATAENILAFLVSGISIVFSFAIIFVVVFLIYFIVNNFSKVKQKLLEKKKNPLIKSED